MAGPLVSGALGRRCSFLGQVLSGPVGTVQEMPRTGAQNRGITRERQVRRLLEDEGWWVSRAAGSLGDADIIALRHDRTPMLIEVKSTTAGPFSGFGPADRRALLAAALNAGAEPWLVWWPPREQPQWIPATDWPSILDTLKVIQDTIGGEL